MDRMSSTSISIAHDFSVYPGPRHRRSGQHSAEEFREDILAPALKRAIERHYVVDVNLDDVAGYGNSFIEEAFAGLMRGSNPFSYEQIRNHLNIYAQTSRFKQVAVRANEYIEDQRLRAASK